MIDFLIGILMGTISILLIPNIPSNRKLVPAIFCLLILVFLLVQNDVDFVCAVVTGVLMTVVAVVVSFIWVII